MKMLVFRKGLTFTNKKMIFSNVISSIFFSGVRFGITHSGKLDNPRVIGLDL